MTRSMIRVFNDDGSPRQVLFVEYDRTEVQMLVDAANRGAVIRSYELAEES